MHLAIDPVAETDEPVADLLDRWPNPDEVQYVIDGPDGSAADRAHAAAP